MLIVVDPHSGVPVYRQLMDQIKFHVSTGLVKPGDELPSTRALSAELGINPMTISKAYSYLERDGVVERRPGRPLVVKKVQDGEAVARRDDQMKEALAPAARVIKQLGVDPDDAIRILRDMLRDESGTEQES
jgi:GntR family transcriptional regulator